MDADAIARPVVVFAGDSLTHGNIGEGFIYYIMESFKGQDTTIVNAGINGDFTWNLLQRIDEIIACRPDIVVVLIGTNDVLLELPIKLVGFNRRVKRLPRSTSKEWYEDLLESLVAELQSRTSAKIALASIPPIGEERGSAADHLVREYCNVARKVASTMNVDYIPVYEAMDDYLGQVSSSSNYPLKEAVKKMILALMAHYLFDRSWDQIAESSNQTIHIDHIHLNSTGARLVAEQVTAYLARILQ